MKILITSIVDLNKTAHNRLHQFVKYLGNSHEIVVLGINDSWKAKQTDVNLYSHGLENALSNVKIEYFTHRKISPTLQELVSVITLSDILNKINYRSFDIHFNYNSLISGYFVSRKMKNIGVNTVYDIADDLPAMILSSPQIPKLLRPVGGFVGNIALRKNVAISKHNTIIAKSLRESLNIPESKTTILPNGVDIDLFKNENSQLIRKQLSLENSFVLGYVGVLREWVDLELVFAAVKSLSDMNPQFNLTILVVGEEGGLNKNKELAQKYGIINQVIFTGTVPYNKVPEYISCMDVCLIPFKKGAIAENSLPLKLFEYMACEKPVIAAPLAGIKEAVDNLVKYALGPLEFEHNIIELWENAELRKTMGMKGKMFVTELYSWSKVSAKLESILTSTAKGIL